MMGEDACIVIREAPKHTILIASVGSRAYGISNPDSDHDFAGVFAIPLSRYLSYCGTGADTIVRHKDPDATFHDVTKFCRLASQGNPNVLEVLWCDSYRYQTEWGEELVGIRKSFLHRGSLKPYFGYYTQQANRLKAGHSLHTKGHEWNPKFGAHLLRLMFAAKHLAQTHEVMVELPPSDRPVVMLARNGEMDAEAVLTLGDILKRRAQDAEKITTLPHLPDRNVIDDFVYRARLHFA